jgi:hypothetical protein
MPSDDFHFVTPWTVRGDVTDVYAILDAAEEYPRWWPATWLWVKVIDPGDAEGIGRVTKVVSKGWLPFTLRWTLRKIESHRPYGYAVEADGFFSGQGRWTLVQTGAEVTATYDWRVRPDPSKPVLAWLCGLAKPILQSNHNWTMARGQESLRLELRRRSARTPEEAALVPAPPGPTFPQSLLYRWRPPNHALLKRKRE